MLVKNFEEEAGKPSNANVPGASIPKVFPTSSKIPKKLNKKLFPIVKHLRWN
jgi:hypothetical protein